MMEQTALQERCVHCKRQQYGPAVLGVSKGEDPCVWCGRMSKVMTDAEYQIALRNGGGK